VDTKENTLNKSRAIKSTSKREEEVGNPGEEAAGETVTRKSKRNQSCDAQDNREDTLTEEEASVGKADYAAREGIKEEGAGWTKGAKLEGVNRKSQI